MVVAKTDWREVYVVAKLSGVYPEPACFQGKPAPYLRALIALRPTPALRAGTAATYGHLDATSVEAA